MAGQDDSSCCGGFYAKPTAIDPGFATCRHDDGRYRESPTTAGNRLGGQRFGHQPEVQRARRADLLNPTCAKRADLLAASADFRHSYPHSWRSKAKIIFRCTPNGSSRWTLLPLPGGERGSG